MLAALANENDWARSWSIEALGNMGAEAASAVDALVPLLGHPDTLTRSPRNRSPGTDWSPGQVGRRGAAQNACQHDSDEATRKAAALALIQVELVERAEKAKLRTLTEVRELIGNLGSADQNSAVAAAQSWGGNECHGRRRGPRPGPGECGTSTRRCGRRPLALGSLGPSARDVLPALQAAEPTRPCPRSAPPPARRVEQVESR